jgi:hypothetical protein
MRIWIISSDHFLNEFRKIANTWTEADKIYITPITKFGIGVWPSVAFFREYRRIKPDRILTDTGYIGIWLVIKLARISGKRIKSVFYLRGNYWLEERGRRENL